MKIVIGGDIAPTKSNEDLFINGRIEDLVGKEILEIFRDADHTVLNLEIPLSDKEHPILKCGPALRAKTETINGLKQINSDFYTLANNHILDQGVQGLQSTINQLKQNSIGFSGVGKNVIDASKPYIFEKNGKLVGIYCCTEHEFSCANNKTAGANPYDPLESYDHVRKLKSNCDYVIVLYHGGKEMYRYPSPMLQKRFRKFAEVGANLVLTQHTHCIGCKEEYKGSTLIYGQGNFLFDYLDNEYWNTSLLITIDINGNNSRIEYIPIQKQGNSVRLANKENSEIIMHGFLERSKEIMQEDFIETTFNKYAMSIAPSYWDRLAGRVSKSLLFRIINKLVGYRLFSLIYSPDIIAALDNIVTCEANEEVLISILKQKQQMIIKNDGFGQIEEGEIISNGQ